MIVPEVGYVTVELGGLVGVNVWVTTLVTPLGRMVVYWNLNGMYGVPTFDGAGSPTGPRNVSVVGSASSVDVDVPVVVPVVGATVDLE